MCVSVDRRRYMGRSLQNNLYMLKLLYKIRPSKILFDIIVSFFEAVLQMVTSVFCLRIVFDKIEEGQAFVNIAFFLSSLFLPCSWPRNI